MQIGSIIHNHQAVPAISVFMLHPQEYKQYKVILTANGVLGIDFTVPIGETNNSNIIPSVHTKDMYPRRRMGHIKRMIIHTFMEHFQKVFRDELSSVDSLANQKLSIINSED